MKSEVGFKIDIQCTDGKHHIVEVAGKDAVSAMSNLLSKDVMIVEDNKLVYAVNTANIVWAECLK